ncbi:MULTISPECIES: hypothetical protein [Aneurinibacillus]|uniref:Uncharacterized protein n=1 Tax=Aneurinibacillus thermoaerophilus TaxID=143495 RepID=A0A1G8AU76_ANETH|nr:MULTISPECIES: hypothetical protein [Aneurinibacillus]AMA72844.1 hypothetical protein ACH33_08245 [Aneurinibacillus sp. XH2]MED0675231.1 hypothetical protein [Aneurinibacillus thermoaerophilus]MED0680073.1 hypothetical protein [Aneurinibacillus thermoaerophilus]MED0738169.1 hypothetical protein [Aneurinibacillus thermoaerophilus]MED0758213.1 hypothetical protein [Aneurinibacillus thermoaerophilus]
MNKTIMCGLMIALAFMFAGCQGQMPKALPEQPEESREVLAQSPSLAVSHSIEGNTVYLTFLTRNFMYVPEGATELRYGEGHVHVRVDGKLSRVYANNFKVGNLTPGAHTFEVELVRNNGNPYPNTKITFTITIKQSQTS